MLMDTMNKSRDTQFGELTVIDTYTVPGGAWRKYANCICSCGEKCTVRFDGLKSGNNRSCGHLLKSAGGLSNTRTYHSWSSMKARCNNPNYAESRYYRERGIKVCERWMESFTNFLEDMGECPDDEHSIDRIDNDGNYEPGNCRWATALVQNNNSRKNIYYEIDGERLTAPQVARKYNINVKRVYSRLGRGLSIHEAIR